MGQKNGISFFVVLKAVFSISCCLLFPYGVAAQTYIFDNYGVEEGLPQSKILSVIQDNKGYVWTATEDGAYRFDGKNFNAFVIHNKDLTENSITAIYEDADHNIWLGHSSGIISMFDGDSVRIINLPGIQLDKEISSFFQDKQKYIWVTTYGAGVIKIPISNNRIKKQNNIKQYLGKEGLSDFVFEIMQDKEGILWFVTDVGIKYLLENKEEFKFFRPEGLPNFQITCILEDKNGDFWFGTHMGGVARYNKRKKSFIYYNITNGLPSNWISDIMEDTEGNIWIATWGKGIAKINKGNIEILNKENGLSDNKIRCMIQDRENNIIFGTNEGGLSIYKGKKFTTFTEKDGLVNNQIWAIFEDSKGNFWFGTNEGLSIYDPGAGSFKNYNTSKGLTNNHIRAIKKDMYGNIWIATWGGGITKYDAHSSEFMNFPVINTFIDNIDDIEIDKQDNLWIATTQGLLKYNISNNILTSYTQTDGLSGNNIANIFQDTKNNIWIGTRKDGLTKYNGVSFQSFGKGLIHKSPTSITEDKDGKIWIGTEGGGVYLFDGEKITHYNLIEKGLLSNYVTLIIADNDNNIWIGTNYGMNKYDQNEDRFYSYGKADGFSGIETKNNAVFKDTKGDLWFGTVNGVIKYESDFDKPNTTEPLTHITNIIVNYEDMNMASGLKLAHKQNSLTFNFIGICLSNPEAVRYQFMLEGEDTKWQSTKESSAVYQRLAPNKYTFKVKACNNDGVWNDIPKTYSFEITPPWYNTISFYIAIAFLILSGFYTYTKWREKNLTKAKKELEREVTKRTEQLNEQNVKLESANKDITDSIEYAKIIQEAILPLEKEIKEIFPESFIFYKPRDIVSGDFYWHTKKDNLFLIAAVDCTGHGVPGAFMSIIGSNLLNEIINEKNITNPTEVLQALDDGIIKALKQGDERIESEDGMDIAFCTIDKKNKKLTYSAAFRPLLFINNKELKEIRGDKYSIGGLHEGEKIFASHDIQINAGDAMYIFSDGYTDQFGGVALPNVKKQGKKYMLKRFKDFLLKTQHLNMHQQEQALIKEFNDWQGELDQVDDVLVIGIKF